MSIAIVYSELAFYNILDNITLYMSNTSMRTQSLKLFIALVIFLAALNALLVFMPMGAMVPAQQVPVSKPIIALVSVFSVLVIYGGLGFVGFILTRYLGIPDIIDPQVSHKQRLFYPAIAGVAVGVVLIVGDILFAPYNLIGNLIHPPFPTSLVASISAGIGEEMIFRLFLITFWTWLISSVILKKKFRTGTYWIMSVIAALLFGFGHFPLLMNLYGFPTLDTIPLILQAEILLLNGIVAIVAAYYYKKAGFLAAVSVHMWTDIVWHVLFGLL
jgi:membrane protease YdiL (CAAX protease family)